MTDEQPKHVPVSQQETRLAFDVPAPFVNKFFVHVSGAGVRLSFAELNPGSNMPSIRSAVLMHPQDAFQLRDVLEVLLKPLEEQFKEAISAQESKNG